MCYPEHPGTLRQVGICRRTGSQMKMFGRMKWERRALTSLFCNVAAIDHPGVDPLSKNLFIWLTTVWTEIGVKELLRNYYSAAISNRLAMRHRPKRSASAQPAHQCHLMHTLPSCADCEACNGHKQQKELSLDSQDFEKACRADYGVTGQDGAYLADTARLGYTVHGVKRRSSSFNTERVDHLYTDPHVGDVRFLMHYGDMTDPTNLIRLIQETSLTKSTTSPPRATSGKLRNPGIHGECRRGRHAAPWKRSVFSVWKRRRGSIRATSELFGIDQEVPQRETTPFQPRTPYRRGEAVCLLDHGELPRSLRHARLKRHPVQS